MDRAAREIEKAQEDAEKALRGQVVALSFSIADAILKRETGTPTTRRSSKSSPTSSLRRLPPAPSRN